MSKKTKKKKKNKKQQQKLQQQNISRYDELVVNMNTTPILLRVFISIGCGVKYVGLSLLAMFAFVMFAFCFDYVLDGAIKELITFWMDFITFWNLQNLFILFILAGPFVLWCIAANWLKKHYKGRNFKACADKVLIEPKKGKVISFTYEELGLSIRTRKIKIGPDWIEIPYDTGVRHMSPEWIESSLRKEKIRLYSFGKRDIGRLLAFLSRKCGTPFETLKMEENIEGYTAGWIMTYYVGWPILIGSVYIWGWIYALEGYKSLWELVKAIPGQHTWVLVVGFVGVLLILLGYGIKLLTFMLLRIYFKPYKDCFHISW